MISFINNRIIIKIIETKHELKLKLFMYYFIILVAIAFITKIFAKLYSVEDIIF